MDFGSAYTCNSKCLGAVYPSPEEVAFSVMVESYRPPKPYINPKRLKVTYSATQNGPPTRPKRRSAELSAKVRSCPASAAMDFQPLYGSFGKLRVPFWCSNNKDPTF